MRYIKLNKTTQQDLLNKFKEHIQNIRTSCDRIEYSFKIESIPECCETATIRITQTAYLKMLLYVRDTSTEIAWHGTVTKEKNTYTINDVFLYPQKITGATVTTDQTEYQDWLEALDEETFNKMRLQGHSHVNFGVSPSGTDYDYYNDILQTLPENEYYIFMIINKSGSENWLIYDIEKNIIFENQDINIEVISETETPLLETLELEKEHFCTAPKAPELPLNYNATSYFNEKYYTDDWETAFNNFKTPKHTYTKEKRRK